ncbi:MAG: hypothetical protein ACJ8LG_21770 [Massilia sp.]
MKRPVRLLAVPLALMLFGSCAAAGAAAAWKNEARLRGAWQEGMNPRIAGWSPEQLRRARTLGLLGGVIRFNADHTFAMYACGAKKGALRKVGLESIKGRWELTQAGGLVSTVTAHGKVLKIETGLRWEGDQMILLNKDGSVASRAGRYSGGLPPSC